MTFESIIEIDRGIPLPLPRLTYPWSQMKVGDSFFVNGDRKVYDRVRCAVKYQNQTTIRKYVTRRKSNGVRVWRMA